MLAVARTGSVLGAAEELFITPSAVSQQLKRLEHEAGRTLVVRSPRGTMLTAAGLVAAEAAEEIERALGNASERLTHGDGPSGTVRIGAVASFLRTLLIPHLSEWRERYPQLLIEVVEGDIASMTRGLRRRDLDAAVVEYDSDAGNENLPAGMIEQPLLDEPWKLVVPAGWWAGRDPIDLRRSSLPWLGVEPGSSAPVIERLRKAAELETPPVHRFYETSIGLSLVAAGQGITVMPALALRGVTPVNVQVLDLPGLGTRRIVLRRYARDASPDRPIDTVTALIRQAVAALDLTDAAG